MAKTETNVSTLKINRGTYAKVQENLSSITENELIITSDKNVPVPTTNDNGKAVVVNASGEYELGNAGMTNPMTTAGDLIVGGANGAPTRLDYPTYNNRVLVSGQPPHWVKLVGTSIDSLAADYGKTIFASAPTGGSMSMGKPASDFGLGTITTAPTADNTDGLKIVVLTAEPATYYDGYYYIIAPST